MGILYEFHTCFAFGKDSLMYKFCRLLPASIFNKLSNRFIDGVPDRFIKRYPLVEIRALVKYRLGKEEENILYKRNRAFQERISNSTIQQSDAVIGFDTSSWILAERSRKFQKPFYLDVSIAHPVSKDSVYRRIIKLYANWKFSVKQKDYKHIAVEVMEMELADHIVVASTFTHGTYVFHGVPPEKISINPYGVDFEKFQPVGRNISQSGLIRFVFVGSVDARKGIPLLLETWSRINKPGIELTLIGPISEFTEQYIRQHYPSVVVKGRIPFTEVIRTFPEYDILIFPSFFEGFGLVIPEAMAGGLPVITTTATCGPDIIENGTDGFIVEPGDADSLKSSIEYFMQHPELIKQFGMRARKKAEQFSWDAYGERWRAELEKNNQVK